MKKRSRVERLRSTQRRRPTERENAIAFSFFKTQTNIRSPRPGGRLFLTIIIKGLIKNNLIFLKFYDIIFIENERRKNLFFFEKSIDSPKIT